MSCAGAAMVVESPESVMEEEKCAVVAEIDVSIILMSAGKLGRGRAGASHFWQTTSRSRVSFAMR
jgi:hypothetical protein